MHLCGGVLPCHLCQAGEGSVLCVPGVGHGSTDPTSALLWADPLDGPGPGHFECLVRYSLTIPRLASRRGRKGSGEGQRRIGGGPLLSFYISG